MDIVIIKEGIMYCYQTEPCDMLNQRRFAMYTKQPKKMTIINILDILKRYTDENHRLSQREIIDILEQEYDMKVDRKAVKRNLMNLIDFGYQVEYSESIRQGKMEKKKLYSRIGIRQIRRCLLRQIKTGLTEHLTMV